MPPGSPGGFPCKLLENAGLTGTPRGMQTVDVAGIREL